MPLSLLGLKSIVAVEGGGELASCANWMGSMEIWLHNLKAHANDVDSSRKSNARREQHLLLSRGNIRKWLRIIPRVMNSNFKILLRPKPPYPPWISSY